MTAELTLHRQAASELSLAEDQTEWTEKQRYALGLGANVTGADLAIYLHVCKRTGLDPFARQIYMLERWTKDGPKQTIQTGIDGYRLIAKRAAGSTGYGYGPTEWCGPDGQWRDVWLSTEPPAAARVVVTWRGNEYPAVALYSEYVQTIKSGDPNAMWKRMPANQLAKCAEALALRKAFPQDLSGIYTDDEMGQADRPTSEPIAKAGTDALRAAVAEPAPAVEDAPVDAEVVDADEWPNDLTDATRKRMFAVFNQHGIKDRDEQLKGIRGVIGREIASRSELTEDEARQVITSVEAYYATQDAGAES